jgi:exopolysaccharide biosynthesis polyprenyl glycosylphosphotransferase
MPHRFKKIIFLGGDIGVLHLALALTLFIRYRLIDGVRDLSPFWRGHWPYFIGVFLIFLLVFYINSLYSLRQMVKTRAFIRRSVNSVIAATLIAMIYFYINPRVDIAPKTNLVIFAAIALIGFIIWRRLAYRLINKRSWQNNIAIIGDGEQAQTLAEDLKKRPELGYCAALLVRNLEELKALEEDIRQKNIRTIILIDDLDAAAILHQALFTLLRHKVNFISYSDFYEQINESIPIENIQQNWFLENLQEAEKNYFDFFKKCGDFFGAACLLIISLPAWPFIAFIIKLDSRGSVIFIQDRVGQNGELFRLYKFRTMRGGDDPAKTASENEKRITAIGRWLRASRLDEIPQLLNILKGEMSFIGPRPEKPELSAELRKQVPFYDTRLLIKPGLSGWDQVSGEYHSSTPDDTWKKLQHDLYYIKHRSLYLDFVIILKTIATILAREGR